MRLGKIALVVVIGLAGPVRADPATPWSVGITDKQKENAKRYLDAGNALLVEKDYVHALEQYRSALAEWDHPAIRFNIVRCLVLLDRPAEASENLELALKYGPAPLEESIYTEALGYHALLAKQVGELAVTCDQSDVKLTLDGKALPACPTPGLRVAAGEHQLVGTKAGLVPRTLEVMVVGGGRREIKVHLSSVEDATRVERRWAAWKPWMIVGAGAAIAGMGGVIRLSASADKESFDRTVGQNCHASSCTPQQINDLGVAGLDDSARRKGLVAVGVIGLGVATVATGAAMVYLNRERRVFETPTFTTAIDVSPTGFSFGVGAAF